MSLGSHPVNQILQWILFQFLAASFLFCFNFSLSSLNDILWAQCTSHIHLFPLRVAFSYALYHSGRKKLGHGPSFCKCWHVCIKICVWGLSLVVHPFNPSTWDAGRSRQISQFYASLVYSLSSRTARATLRNHVSRNKTKNKQTNKDLCLRTKDKISYILTFHAMFKTVFFLCLMPYSLDALECACSLTYQICISP